MNSYLNGDTFSPEPRSVDGVTSVIEVEQFAYGAMRYGEKELAEENASAYLRTLSVSAYHGLVI